MLATLNQCGNPSSGFFDPLLNDIPTILNTLSGGSSSATAQSLLQQGLTQIANAEQGSQGRAVHAAAPAPAQKAPASTTTTTTTTVPKPTTTTTTSCGLLGAVLGCPGELELGFRFGPIERFGILRLGPRRVAVEPGRVRSASQSTATVAVAAPSAVHDRAEPTLTAPAATLLPPLPPGRNRARHAHAHRGLLAGWVHDVEGWF